MKVNYHIHNGLVGCSKSGTIEVDDQDLEDLDTAERNALIDEIVQDVVNERIEWGWSEAE